MGQKESDTEFDPAAYQELKHGDVFSGMYFDGTDGVPAWGTYGILQELPQGLNKQQVLDFMVQGGRLELIKKLSPDLPEAQKQNLQHIPGWMRKERSAESAAADNREPIVPKIDHELIQPDKAISYTPIASEPGSFNAPVAADNLAGLSVKNVPPGAPIERLISMIQGSRPHVEASNLAAELHKQARGAPETKA